MCFTLFVLFFVFNDTATTEIYTLSLHDALPIFRANGRQSPPAGPPAPAPSPHPQAPSGGLQAPGSPRCAAPEKSLSPGRSEEHTSELQSRQYLVCRLLLEKKTNRTTIQNMT